MRVVKMDDTGSVLIKSKNVKVWVDVYEDGDETTADWNKYIFFKDNEEDQKIKKFQDSPENAGEAFNLAINHYQDNFKK